VYTKYTHVTKKNKMKWHYGKSRAPTAVSMQSICARVHSQSGVFTIPLYCKQHQLECQT